MTEPQHNSDEICRLLWAMREDELAPGDAERLRSMLLEDPHARELYVYYMFLSGSLEWDSSARAKGRGTGDGRRGMAGSPAIDLPVGAAVELPLPSDLKSQIPDPRTPIPDPPFPSLSTTHYPLPTSYFSVGSWAFSCMVSAVIVCVMLLVFWAIKVTPRQHIAEAPAQSAPSEAMPEMVFVGRITGMVDVKWSDDPRFLPPLSSRAYVPLGRKYELVSGLMEITYDSGAKVILQGPCTYEVESTAGGYLALGKLTAKVEKERSEVRGQKSDHYPLSTIHYPLFSVRTPTALITDLGTEFGVEVDEVGVTESHVFRGSVKVEVVSDEGRGHEVILGENESARVERAEDRLVIVRGAASEKTARFIRAMPRPKPAVPVRIVETFDGVELGTAFEQMPPGRYAIRQGAAEHPRQEPLTPQGRQSRGYIRTVAADFCDRDFVFEATFHVRLDGPAHVPGSNAPHHIFFGLGDGVPNANCWDIVTCGLVLNFCVDNGQAWVGRCDPESDLNREVFGNLGGTVTEVVPLGGLSPGRHRFRLTKTGRCVKFAVDADFNGEFQPDFISRPIDLPTAVPLLDATNSRLLVGTGNCDVMTVRFEELSVTYLKTPKEE